MIYEKDQSAITTENQPLVSDTNVDTDNTNNIDDTSNVKNSADSMLYDNMIFPS